MGFVPCLQKQDTLEIERRYIFKKLPLFCPKCKQERIISAENLKIVVIEETSGFPKI